MKLLEKFEAVARQRRLADNTIDAYRAWIQQFLRFSAAARRQWTRPEELGTADVEAFLNDLVSRRRLSAIRAVVWATEDSNQKAAREYSHFIPFSHPGVTVGMSDVTGTRPVIA